jgi:hypothetical protein
MSRILDIDPLSGAIETFDYDEASDTIIIRRRCDVQPVIDRNKELASERDGGWIGKGRDVRLAASIPVEVAYKWLNELGVNCWKKEHWPAVRKLLNSNEYQHLRTNHFRL